MQVTVSKTYTNLYATDGDCHNAEPGTYSHECGKPADWLGILSDGFASGFCNDCKRYGYEAKKVKEWYVYPKIKCEETQP